MSLLALKDMKNGWEIWNRKELLLRTGNRKPTKKDYSRAKEIAKRLGY